jgi:hypothetical protein
MFYYPVVPTWPHPLMNPDSTCQKSFFSISSYEILSFPVIPFSLKMFWHAYVLKSLIYFIVLIISIIFTKNGNLLYTYHGSGPIFQLQWSPRGDKLAACVSDTTVSNYSAL